MVLYGLGIIGKYGLSATGVSDGRVCSGGQAVNRSMDAMSLEEEYDDQASALYRKHAGRVQGFLISTGCDRGLAEEITDDAFLAARRRWAQVRNLDLTWPRS